MRFYTPREQFTHTARFYGIPVYLNLEDAECPVVSGQNIIYDRLFNIASYIHNTFIKFFAQLFAYIFNYEYEAGIAFWVTGEIEK